MEPEPKRKRGRPRLTDAQRSNAAEKRKQTHREYDSVPEVKEKLKQTRREYDSVPEVKEKQKQTRREYDSVPEVKEKQTLFTFLILHTS